MDADLLFISTFLFSLQDPSERTGGLFFEGNFSEEESALSFAQALAEWRAGKDADSSAPSQTKDLKKGMEKILHY